MTSSATPEQRISQTVLKNNLSIKDVTGGKETNPMVVSNVSSSDFERALEISLQASGLFSPPQTGKYQLIAHIEKIDQPFIGLDFTVTATVRYTVYENATGNEIFSKSLAIPYTAKLGDSLLGVERLRLANEGAIRSNISELINELFNLKINSLSLK